MMNLLFQLIFSLFLVSSISAVAQVQAPVAFNYQGRITDLSGSAIEEVDVDFTIQLLSHDGSCLLYEETHSNVDMSSSNGIFSLAIGSGAVTGNDSGFSFLDLFSNLGTLAHANLSCAGNSYTPNSNDTRKLSVSFDLNDANGITTLTPSQTILASPYAIIANSLQGLLPTDLINITGNVTQANMVELTGGGATALHTHTDYVSSGGNVGNDAYTTDQFAIGTSSTEAGVDLTFGGSADKVIQMARMVGGDFIGNALTIQAGGATSGQTDIAGGNLVLSSGISTGSGGSKIEFKTASAGASSNTDVPPTTKMTILENGYVGIGTTSPNTKLHVYDGIMSLEDPDGSTYLNIKGNGGAQLFLYDSEAAANQKRKSIKSRLGRIYISKYLDNWTQVPQVTVDNDGNVGIGTTAPSQTLDLIGALELETTTTATSGVIYKGADPFIHNFSHPTGATDVPAGNNTFVGINSGNFTMGSTASQAYHASTNTGIGANSLSSLINGYHNTAIGAYALRDSTAGISNVAIGESTLINSNFGKYNSVVGRRALYLTTSGSYNSALGSNALYDNTTGEYNIAIGHDTGKGITTGSKNTIIGSNVTGLDPTLSNKIIIADGDGNKFIHNYSHPDGDSAVPTGENTFVGMGAGNFTMGSTATAVAHGSYNTAVGTNSLAALTTGFNNTALGKQALISLTAGYNNNAVGTNALLMVTTGTNNNAIGTSVLRDITTGYHNTAMGYNSGQGITTGDYNTIIGSQVTGLDADLNNNVIIADGEGNQRIRIDETGNVGIGTTTPYTIHADANLFATKNPKMNILTGTDTGAYEEFVTIRHSAGSVNAVTRRLGLLLKLSNDNSENESNKMGGMILDTSSGWANIPSLSLVTKNQKRLTILHDGNVGIGTTIPESKLQITGGGLCVGSNADCNSDNNTEGSIYASNTTIQAADYAEYFEAEISNIDDLEKGDIVGINPNTNLVRAYQAGDKLIGIVSTNPGVIGNSKIKDDNSILVALMGQVPFNTNQTYIDDKNIVKTLDGKVIGHLLASNNLYLNISSANSDIYREISSTKSEISKLKEENKSMKEFLCSKFSDASFCN